MYIIKYEWTKPNGEKIESSITTNTKQKAAEIAEMIKNDLALKYKCIGIETA